MAKVFVCNPQEASVFTIEEAAAYLRCTTDFIEKLIEDGNIAHRNIPDVGERISRYAIDDWLNERGPKDSTTEDFCATIISRSLRHVESELAILSEHLRRLSGMTKQEVIENIMERESE